MNTPDSSEVLRVCTNAYRDIHRVVTEEEYTTFLNNVNNDIPTNPILENIMNILPMGWQNSKNVFERELLEAIRFQMNEVLHNLREQTYTLPNTLYTTILNTITNMFPDITQNIPNNERNLPSNQSVRTYIKEFLNATSLL